MPQSPSRWSWVNERVLMRLFGAAGLAHETLLRDLDRPTLLAIFAGLLGLPEFLRLDRKREEAASEESKS